MWRSEARSFSWASYLEPDATDTTMWPIDEFELRNVQLGFTSSGGGHPRTRAVYSTGTCLVNALGYTELGKDPTQLIVCEVCGNVQCQSGGWVQIRRVGESISFIPAFTRMLEGDFQFTEFSPPSYLYSRGTPLFNLGTYEQLRIEVPTFPSVDDIKRISASEAVRLIQWQAPLFVLGRFPSNPRLVRSAVLAVSNGDLDVECDRIQEFLNANLNSDDTLSAFGSGPAELVEFYVDGPGFPAWRPVANAGNRLAFNFELVSQLLSVQ